MFVKKIINLIRRGWRYYVNWRTYYLSFFVADRAKADIIIFVIVFFAVLFAVGPFINEYVSTMEEITKEIVDTVGEEIEDKIEEEVNTIERGEDKENKKE